MSMVYFFTFKKMKALVLPLFALDYYLWGPYYMNGA
eukprot:CAMPEP_0170519386 /NCGR_PEP_ID=MMETSP0209-20121228/4825_1 /TAXON_ID=665100 ORGANISM="Litonotus pictus, Strain P1" /NCGR_SAMPLE_ID=MMETSP0209 /ASSEMBLY_ACC=CAM_ASM_000301 /LENGTH=35 /DNA_ID= /DNA_START= /DNA_END= /DNA_ORIENTATION=